MRMQSGPLTPAQQQNFQDWLAASPKHKIAWRQTQGIWQGLEQLTSVEIAAIIPKAEKAKRKSRAIRLPAFAMAVIVLAALLHRLPFWFADYSTGTETSSPITLSDGSTLELNADSAVSVDFTREHRRLVLHQGEAFFTVAKDTARPFDVTAGRVEVRALGTMFNIKQDGHATRVTVFEHAVKVTAESRQISRLGSGHTATATGGSLTENSAENLTAIDGWRQHRLIFADRTLAEVIETLNKYRRWPIILLEPELRNRTVTGIFDTVDTDTALETIQQTMAVKLRRIPGGLAVISTF